MLQLSPYIGTVATVPRGSCNSHLDVIKLLLRHIFGQKKIFFFLRVTVLLCMLFLLGFGLLACFQCVFLSVFS